MPLGPRPLSNATPAAVGTADAGTSTSPARGDHAHAHGNQAAGGALHAVATTSVNGFMSSSDKAKLDGISGGPGGVIPAGIGRLAVEPDTVSLYPFNRSLTDSGVNAFALQLLAGTLRYAPLFPGYWGLFLPAGNRIQQVLTNTALRITGDMTLEFIGNPLSLSYVASNRIVYHGSDSTGNSTHNAVWAFQWYQSGGGDIAWAQQFGTNSFSSGAWTEFLPPPFRPVHIACVRESGVVSVYVDGTLVATSAALTTPTDGTSGRLIVGNATHTGFQMADLRISNTAHSAAKVLVDYMATTGSLFTYGGVDNGPENVDVDLVPKTQLQGTVATAANVTSDVPVPTGKRATITVSAWIENGSGGFVYFSDLVIWAHNTAGVVTVEKQTTIGSKGTGYTLVASVSGTNVRLTLANTSGSTGTYQVLIGSIFADKP